MSATSAEAVRNGGINAIGTARVLDGRRLSAEMLDDTRRELEAFRAQHGSVPSVVIVIMGEDPASRVYARQILRAAQRVGSSGRVLELPAATGHAGLREVIGALSDDDSVGGIIFQLPLPARLQVRRVIDSLNPLKDIDGIHPLNAGLVSRGHQGFAPSCAEAALVMLKRHDVPLAGRPAVVVGRSNVVGRPAQLLLMRENATVTVCHRQTRDLGAELRRAEIVIVAAGSPGLVRGDAIQPGAVVIDCGINVLEDGSLVGDVDWPSVVPVAGAVTPVPGGIGPLTNAVLMSHLARAVAAQQSGGFPDALAVEAIA